LQQFPQSTPTSKTVGVQDGAPFDELPLDELAHELEPSATARASGMVNATALRISGSVRP
jgi:hypothetical protein